MLVKPILSCFVGRRKRVRKKGKENSQKENTEFALKRWFFKGLNTKKIRKV